MECTFCNRDEKEHPAKYKLVRWIPPMKDYACEECYQYIRGMNPYLTGRVIKNNEGYKTNKFAIFNGALLLGWGLIKSLFVRDTHIYRCPKCNLVIKNKKSCCIRCGTLIDWKRME